MLREKRESRRVIVSEQQQWVDPQDMNNPLPRVKREREFWERVKKAREEVKKTPQMIKLARLYDKGIKEGWI